MSTLSYYAAPVFIPKAVTLDVGRAIHILSQNANARNMMLGTSPTFPSIHVSLWPKGSEVVHEYPEAL